MLLISSKTPLVGGVIGLWGPTKKKLIDFFSFGGDGDETRAFLLLSAVRADRDGGLGRRPNRQWPMGGGGGRLPLLEKAVNRHRDRKASVAVAVNGKLFRSLLPSRQLAVEPAFGHGPGRTPTRAPPFRPGHVDVPAGDNAA